LTPLEPVPKEFNPPFGPFFDHMMTSDIVPVVMVLMGTVLRAGDQQAPWRQTVRDAVELQSRGQLLEAENVLHSTLDQADPSTLDGIPRVTVLNHLGVIYHQLGRHAVSEHCLLRAIALSKKTGDDLLTGHVIGNLAALYVDLDSYAKIERLDLPRWVAVWETSRPDAPELPRLLTCLGAVAMHRRRYSDAERLHKHALAIAEEFGHSHESGTIHNNLGMFYLQIGRHLEALACLRRALEISESNKIAEHPSQAPLLLNLAETERVVHGPAAAEPFYKRALAVMEFAVDANHPLRADILFQYARALRDMKRKDEARQCERRAKSIQEAARVMSGQETVDIGELVPANSKRF
jgi:tetratricopeptide (TPR) repeat protein